MCVGVQCESHGSYHAIGAVLSDEGQVEGLGVATVVSLCLDKELEHPRDRVCRRGCHFVDRYEVADRVVLRLTAMFVVRRVEGEAVVDYQDVEVERLGELLGLVFEPLLVDL